MPEHEYLKLTTERGWWFHLGRLYGAKAVAYPDGTPLAQSPRNDQWWEGPSNTDEVHVTMPAYGPIVGYVLRDPDMESVACPLHRTVDEWEALGESRQELYVSERGEPSERVDVVDLTGAPVLGGTPYDRSIIPPGASWSANLPHQLREHREYLHLFPGKLTGFRTVLRDHLDGSRGVTAYDSSGDGFHGWVRVAYPDLFAGMPQRMKKKSPGSRKLVPDTSTPYTSIRWKANPPREIPGANLAEAVEAWEAKLAEYLGWFDAVQARAVEIVAQLTPPTTPLPEGPGGITVTRS